MKKLTWMIRYALQIRRRSMSPLWFCWQAAQIAANEWLPDEWREWEPEDAADEEMSYWGD